MRRTSRLLAVAAIATGAAAATILGTGVTSGQAVQIIGHDQCGNPTVKAGPATIHTIPCPGPVIF